MTIINRFFNWQRSGLNWDAPPYEACSPALMSLLTWLLNNHGGQSLGCHGDRAVRAGTAPSSHAFGAALDWRYENPGPGRQYALDVVLPFVLAHSDQLGVQAIHDYAGDRIWRPPGHSGRLVSSDGWKAQNGAGGQMGRSWAQWFHFEIHPDDFDDARTVEDKLKVPPPPPPPPPPIKESPDMFRLFVTNAPASPTKVTVLLCDGTQLSHVKDGHFDQVLAAAGVGRVDAVNANQTRGTIVSCKTTTACPPEWVGTTWETLWNGQRA